MTRTISSTFRLFSLVLIFLLSTQAFALAKGGVSVMVTNLNDSGSGSLRNAVAIVNAQRSGHVVFSPLLAGGTVQLISPIVVTTNLTLQGPSGRVSITASQNFLRALSFGPGTHVVEDVDFRDNRLRAGAYTVPLLIGGAAIYNEGNLTLRRCAFVGNYTDSYNDSQVLGGAIYTTGNLTLETCDFSYNRADGKASEGGAIYAAGAAVSMYQCRFSDNYITAFSGSTGDDIRGGALSLHNGSLMVNASAFRANRITYTTTSYSFGGAISVVNSSAELVNSTFTENYASSSYGYYTIYHHGGAISAVDADLTLRFCTIAGNRVGNGSNTMPQANKLGGGVYFHRQTSGSITLQTSIIADNWGTPDYAGPEIDLYVKSIQPYSPGGNVVERFTLTNAGSNTNAWLHSTDQTGVGAQLLGFAYNGGPTGTMALGCNSPARNTIAFQAGMPSTDQRGLPRVQDGLVDAGAYEAAPAAEPNSGINAPASHPYNSTISLSAQNPNANFTYQWEAWYAVSGSTTQTATGSAVSLATYWHGKQPMLLKLTVTTPEGCQEEYLDTVRMVNARWANTLENESQEHSQEVLLYPNPAQDLLNWQAGSPLARIRVLTLQGQEVMTESLHEAMSGTLSLSGLAPGLYCAVLEGAEGTPIRTVRFIKQ